MSTIRRNSILMLVAAAFLLGTIGCKSSGKDGNTVQQEKDSDEKPKGDHPKH